MPWSFILFYEMTNTHKKGCNSNSFTHSFSKLLSLFLARKWKEDEKRKMWCFDILISFPWAGKPCIISPPRLTRNYDHDDDLFRLSLTHIFSRLQISIIIIKGLAYVEPVCVSFESWGFEMSPKGIWAMRRHPSVYRHVASASSSFEGWWS